MKLSFSISSKPSSRPPTTKPPQSFNHIGDPNHENGRHDEANPHFFTVFDPSENPSSNSTAQPVIAPSPNSDLQSHVKTKNLHLPTTDETTTQARFVLDTSGNASSGSEANRYGLIIRSSETEGKSLEGDARVSEMRRVREQREGSLDDEPPDVMVEGYGASFLAEFGWVEGKSIGGKGKEDPKVFEHKRRAGTEGFGAAPQELNSASKNLKENMPSLSKSVNENDGYPKDRDERKRESYDRKKMMRKDKNCEESRRVDKRRKNDAATSTAERSPAQWLRNHIRVRIISKKFGGGRYYLKKGEVVDVVGPTTCDIMMDESGELFQGVDQSILETALPKRGGWVLVLYGNHKGVYGTLVERDSERETGLVRDADSHALINVLLEQIAEYVGDPSYLGY